MSAKETILRWLSAVQGLPRRLTRQKLILIAAAAVFLTGVVMLGAATYQRSAAYRSRIVDLRMEAIGELSTQAAYFTNVQVISNSREIFGVTVPFTQSKYIYSYDGVIRAGVDFAGIDYTIDARRRTVTVSVPPARITAVSVDENSLEVYNEAQSIFTPLTLGDMQASRQQMELEAREQAIGNGLLESAAENARLLIHAFLQSDPALQDYEFIWPEAAEEVTAP